MSDRDNELLDPAVDPPNNDGGNTTTTTKTAGALDSQTIDAAMAVDPPNNDGGTK